jgi:hypothetical protein
MLWKREPLAMKRALWPDLEFYDKQIEVIHSVRDNIETYVPAGNMLGKDFLSGFLLVWFFISHYSSDTSRNWVRIVTTSATAQHLKVLWGEVDRWVVSSRLPLLSAKGGPLYLTQHNLRWSGEEGSSNPRNYATGMVAGNVGVALQGHHAEHTLFIIDEASGVSDISYNMGMTWAKRALIIGNPHPCNNFFKRGVTEGDVLA